MTDSGPVSFDLKNPSPISISSSGEISQGGVSKGRLKLVDFNDPHLLTSIGGGCFMANDPKLVTAAVAQPSVRQGFLESANTSPVAEMANLLTVMRTFEATQKTIQMNDERMGRVINDLGNSA